MKIQNIFKLYLFILGSNKKITQKELSKMLCFSERSISRYIDCMIVSGIPVNKSRSGGVYIDDEYKKEFKKSIRLRGIKCKDCEE